MTDISTDASRCRHIVPALGASVVATIVAMGRLRIDRITGPPAPLIVGGGGTLCRRGHRARSRLACLVGLLATADLADDEAVWIEGCSSVHTLGLRAAIGCAFLDRHGRVLRVVDPLPRWRIASARRASVVVECRAGVLARVAVGDVLRLC